MGLLFSAILSYAGALEAIECIKHILSGIVPEGDPDFQELVDYYNGLLRKSSQHNSSSIEDWTTKGGQGYLCLTESEEGHLKSVAVKYYDGHSDSVPILFSTKISSFGQESIESIISNSSTANGDCGNNRTERYSTTRTIISNASESFSVGRNRSPTASYENISDPTVISANSFASNEDYDEKPEVKEKLTWHYRPLSPVLPTLPDIQFQSYDETYKEGIRHSEDFLRSLDGIKLRPLQRSDPSGRRRSFKKRHSSSSNSSKESRASREEELKMFTSLEEAEFERMNKDENVTGFGSTPNLATHSYSRSRSRENSNERRGIDTRSLDASLDSSVNHREYSSELKPRIKDVIKLDSFEEERPDDATDKQNEVNEDDNEEDFWGNSGE